MQNFVCYFKRMDNAGMVYCLITYDNFRPNITDPLMVEITAEEYAALSAEVKEKVELANKLYTGQIDLSDVPKAWREEIQARVDEIIASQGAYDAQDISDTEALQIIMGGGDA